MLAYASSVRFRPVDGLLDFSSPAVRHALCYPLRTGAYPPPGGMQ